MKRLILISTMITAASAAFAQSQCSQNSPIYKFNDNSGAPKEIHRLGAAPEFPFLRNKTSAHELYMAIRKSERGNMNKAAMSELNGMLMEIGYADGAQDLRESNISMQYLPSGTQGNMGSAGYTYSYTKLMAPDPEGFKAWKIASPSGNATCNLYIMAKCGNAFYPKAATTTACINVPVNLTGDDSKEVTLDGAAVQNTTDKVYVYYHKRHRRRALSSDYADLTDPKASTPILVSKTDKMSAVPQTYRVTVSTPDNSVQVCPDQTLDVATNINVEKESEYTGYYPKATSKNYKLVSRRVYRKTLHKMRKARRKENRVSQLTGVEVNR